MASVTKSSFLAIVELSCINVENVVKPPQSPVVSINFMDGDNHAPVASMPERNPMTKHPNTLTVSVPKGKDKIVSV